MNKYAAIYLKAAQGYYPDQTPYPEDKPGMPLQADGAAAAKPRPARPGPDAVTKAILQKKIDGWPNISYTASPTN